MRGQVMSSTVLGLLRTLGNRRICALGRAQLAKSTPFFRNFAGDAAPKTSTGEKLTVTFKRPNGDRTAAAAKVGDTLLDVIINNNIDIDGFGACEGTLSCSTCHVILKQEDFDKIKEKPTDEELDMLDLAYGLTDTSRLGCQIFLTKEHDGLEVEIPEGINDVRAES